MKISTKQYAQALYELTLEKSEGEVNIVVEKFVKELAKNNNIKLASKIVDKFEEIYNKNNGIIVAEVTSTNNLDKDYLDKIEKYLINKYVAKHVVLTNKIDASIKGGIILRVGEDVLDESIIKKVNNLKIFLAQ
ncbi:MAG: F0F1 ATP synthase subunit delta [Parcubacteria group bacterium]|jgi:F-type H+-transporting ATPase subunit delta